MIGSSLAERSEMQIVKVVFVTVIVTLAFRAGATTVPEEKPDRLIRALIQVESHGKDNAIGDKHMREKAYGPLQIRKPCVDDVNRRFGTKIRSEDLLGNRSLSIWVCRKYLEMYATTQRLGRVPTEEDRARIWNGGPTGWQKQSTIQYWVKVKKAMAGK